MRSARTELDIPTFACGTTLLAKASIVLIRILVLTTVLLSGTADNCFSQKTELARSIGDRSDASWRAALQIWDWAEPGYQESRSAELLADMLKKAEFEGQRGVAEIPTAFTATFGQGNPVIGILGEFDALPGLSQTDSPLSLIHI